MFGETYFETRTELVDLASRVVDLAGKSGANAAALTEGEVAEGLESPYLFVACGETGAGKSSVLDAVFGKRLCTQQAGGHPVRWFRHGELERERRLTEGLEQCDRPEGFLERFNLMDTPGIEQGAVRTVLDRFLPACDLALWVISVENPWGAAVWDFFARQDESVLRKSLILLQKKDLRDDKELEIIQGHIRDLARQRLVQVPPVLVVSAEQALQAKLADSLDAVLWRRSGYPELEKQIADAVVGSEARVRILSNIRAAISEVLRQIELAIDERSEQLKGNEAFLRELESELERERERQTADFHHQFAELGAVLDDKNVEFAAYLRGKLGLWASLKSLLLAENTARVIENRLIGSIQGAVESQAALDGECVIERCQAHWETVRPRVKERFSIRLGRFDDGREGFDDLRDGFIERMGASALAAVQSLRMRKDLNVRLVARGERLKNWLYLGLVLLMFAGVFGFLGLGQTWFLSPALAGFSLCFFVGFAVDVGFSGRKIMAALRLKLASARLSFSSKLEEDYHDAVRQFFVEYGGRLGGVRQHILEQQRELEPNQEQRSRLFLELMILEREL